MSLLHSFYCWGHAGVILLSTAFFAAFGVENWRVLACLWGSVPFINAFYFSQVPISTLTEAEDEISLRELLRQKMFWIMVILMICAGACEQGISQWASAFAEAGLNVSKTVGDLAGPCAFALLMGSSRALYAKFSEKLPLLPFMGFCGVLCLISYLLAALSPLPAMGLLGCALCGLSVGILWPGSFSLAAGDSEIARLQPGRRGTERRRNRHVCLPGPGRRCRLLRRPFPGGICIRIK